MIGSIKTRRFSIFTILTFAVTELWDFYSLKFAKNWTCLTINQECFYEILRNFYTIFFSVCFIVLVKNIYI